jgi:energy-coupling factor transporter ATP-binding protein EcfA2
MPDPLSTAAVAFLGMEALKIIGDAVKGHVKGHIGKLLTKGEQRLLGKEKCIALEDAYENALTHAYAQALEALGNLLNLTVSSGTEFAMYRNPVENLLNSASVAEHLLESVRDLSNDALPDPKRLEREWKQAGGVSFPFGGVWELVAFNFRKGAMEKTFITPPLRDILNAQNLDEIRQLQQKLLGVQVAVRHEQYVSRMLKKYGGVELANIAPAYADDPGQLIVTDIFEPQHVRENPPPVEISKDEFEKLAREGKLDKNDEQAVIAMLEEGEGKETAQRLRFQRASYAEQPVRPVLDVISNRSSMGPQARASAARSSQARGTSAQGSQATNQATKTRLLVITGEPGSGKSTLLRYLLLGVLNPPTDPDDPTQPLAWTEGFTGGNEHFPFLIELRDYYFTCKDEPKVNSFLNYFQHLGEAQGYGIDAEWLNKRLENGPSLALFDGLDEIFDAGDRDEIMQQIVGFVETYPAARVIVTSRPHGYHEGILRPAGFVHFRLQDLDREQTDNFTRAWFKRVFPQSPQDATQRVDRVLDSIERSDSIRWLAGNPMLLTIMCLIAREKELPRERARFYDQCIDVLVHQWEINRHLQDENLAFLDVDDKKELLRRIAFHMQSSEAGLRGNFIAERELLVLTQAWFEETFEDLKGTKARDAATTMIKGLWERNYLLCPRGPKLYGFLHRTLMEFLTATEYVRRFQRTPDFTLDDLDAVFREHGNEPEWSEVLRLICGEVGDEFAEKLIRTLLALKEFPTKELDDQNQPNHLVLGIRCMSELRGLSKMDELGRTAIETCLDFLRGERHGWPLPPFLEDFLGAVAEIGTRWPEGGSLLDYDINDSEFEGYGYELYPEVDAAIVRDRSRIQTFACREVELKSGEVEFMRAHALIALYRWWRDEKTRQFLSQRAVEDEDYEPRARALELLAGHEPWADDATRQLLSQRAVEDESDEVRAKALELLAGHEAWADHEETLAARQRFLESIRDAAEPRKRGAAACVWFGTVGSSDPLSDAKRRVFSHDADGVVPFLDPREPVSDEHLAKVAKSAGLSEDRIDEMVEQMNQSLGWDIRKGLAQS